MGMQNVNTDVSCDLGNSEGNSVTIYTKPWYRAQISKLNDEIFTLEARLKKKDDRLSFSTLYNFNDILNNTKLLSSLSEDKRALLEGSDIKVKLDNDMDGEINIESLENLTGLRIREIVIGMEEESGNICVEKRYIHGSSYGVEFKTTFLMEENMEDDIHDADAVLDRQEVCASTNRPRVISLDVSIENEEDNLNFGSFLQYVKETKQLQQFFVTLQKYSKLKQDRIKTFNHFQKDYPQLVSYASFQDKTRIAICNQQHPSVRVMIVWKVLVTREGEVKPSFDLQSCIPTEHLDDKDFLKNIRLKFLTLVKYLEIEQSIELVVLMLAK